MNKEFYFEMINKFKFLINIAHSIESESRGEDFIFFIKSGLEGMVEDIDAYIKEKGLKDKHEQE